MTPKGPPHWTGAPIWIYSSGRGRDLGERTGRIAPVREACLSVRAAAARGFATRRDGTARLGLSLRTKLGFLAATATAAVLAATSFLTVRYFRGQLLSILAEASSAEGDLLRVVLEEQMMAGERALLHRVVSEIGRQPNITWVGLVDADGCVQVSSDPAELDRVISRDSPDCQVCHSLSPKDRSGSVTLVRPGGSVLRSVTPFINREPCQTCHDEQNRINGMLIIDRSLSPLEAAVLSSRTQVTIGGAAALIALLGSLGLAVEHFVLLRLHRLRAVAHAFGRGDLGARAAPGYDDELGQVAREFNTMADRLGTTLGHLAAERRKLDELVNGIGDGLVLVDASLRLIATNRAFARRLPAATRAEPGSSYRELARFAGFEGAAPPSTPAERALGSGRLEKELIRVRSPSGERFEEIYAQPLRSAEGDITGAIEVWRDVTERQALEAGLEQSERLAGLGIIASSVAHEVGNPLAAIAMAVQGLLRRLDDPGGAPAAELREYLEIVSKQVFRCHVVTQRLLGFARVPSRRPATVDAAQAAREVLALVAPQARAQLVEVTARLPEPIPVAAEEMLLEQVFLNLVLNALQAMPGGGALAVEAVTRGDEVLVTVSDTGPGIPASVREHLFQPFRRAREGGVGTGLGLFLSQALVQRCGGSIEVQSEAGKGTAFTVRLHRGANAASTGVGA